MSWTTILLTEAMMLDPAVRGANMLKRFMLLPMFMLMALGLGSLVNSPAYAQAQDAGSNTAMQYAQDDAGTQANSGNFQQSAEEWASSDTCWGCTLLAQMASTIDRVGSDGQAIFGAGASKALGAFMMLWVTYQLFMLMSVTHAHSPTQSIDKIANRLILMIILMGVLNTGSYSVIMKGSALTGNVGVFTIMNGVLNGSAQLIHSARTCNIGSSSSLDAGKALIPGGVQMMCALHTTMGQGLAIGFFIMKQSWTGIFTFHLLELIGGLIIFVAFGLMMIMMPFKLFDAMIRIAVVACILPLIVVAGQFALTKGLVKQAVTSVIAAILTFVFTAISVGIAIDLLNALCQDLFTRLSNDSHATDLAFGCLSGKDFMILLACALGIGSFVSGAGKLAAEFAGFQGDMGSVGGGGAAMVGSAIGNVAGGVAGGVGRGAGALLGSVGGPVGTFMGAALGGAMTAMKGGLGNAGKGVDDKPGGK